MRTVSCLEAPASTQVQARRPPPSSPPMTPPQSGQTTASTDIEMILSSLGERLWFKSARPLKRAPPPQRRRVNAIVARVPRRDEVHGPRASRRRGGFIVSFVKHNARLPDFLPGRLVLGNGTGHDYRALAAFHYAAGAPATWAGVWVVRYHHDRTAARDGGRTVA